MTDNKETSPIEVTVASGRQLKHGTGSYKANEGELPTFKEKTLRAGEKVELEATEAHRLAALGFVVLPGAEDDAPADTAGTENAPRNKGRFSISPKDGPRIDR